MRYELARNMKCMLHRQTLTDTSVTVEGLVEGWQVHRIVLASASPVFRQAFECDVAHLDCDQQGGHFPACAMEQDANVHDLHRNAVKTVHCIVCSCSGMLLWACAQQESDVLCIRAARQSACYSVLRDCTFSMRHMLMLITLQHPMSVCAEAISAWQQKSLCQTLAVGDAGMHHKLELVDVTAEAVSLMLDFLYGGFTASLTFSLAKALFQAIHKYEVKELQEQCERALQALISVEVFDQMVEVATRCNCAVLIEMSVKKHVSADLGQIAV